MAGEVWRDGRIDDLGDEGDGRGKPSLTLSKWNVAMLLILLSYDSNALTQVLHNDLDTT